MLEIFALSAACLLIGVILGFMIAERHEARKDVAPLPDFDRNNPINAQARKEIYQGVEWTVYGGYTR